MREIKYEIVVWECTLLPCNLPDKMWNVCVAKGAKAHFIISRRPSEPSPGLSSVVSRELFSKNRAARVHSEFFLIQNDVAYTKRMNSLDT